MRARDPGVGRRTFVVGGWAAFLTGGAATADARAATGEGRPALEEGQTVAADPDLGHVFVDGMQDEVFTWLDSVL
ncbi:hypothetical protein [Streptomyces sp. NPDC005476]|uniref:hypothetical protein n=1 Tax=Streptomyces sp. NPDC005476 TaxID=3156882 RepID=UPI0034539B99